jgi:hypothetical protein
VVLRLISGMGVMAMHNQLPSTMAIRSVDSSSAPARSCLLDQDHSLDLLCGSTVSPLIFIGDLTFRLGHVAVMHMSCLDGLMAIWVNSC